MKKINNVEAEHRFLTEEPIERVIEYLDQNFYSIHDKNLIDVLKRKNKELNQSVFSSLKEKFTKKKQAEVFALDDDDLTAEMFQHVQEVNRDVFSQLLENKKIELVRLIVKRFEMNYFSEFHDAIISLLNSDEVRNLIKENHLNSEQAQVRFMNDGRTDMLFLYKSKEIAFLSFPYKQYLFKQKNFNELKQWLEIYRDWKADDIKLAIETGNEEIVNLVIDAIHRSHNNIPYRFLKLLLDAGYKETAISLSFSFNFYEIPVALIAEFLRLKDKRIIRNFQRYSFDKNKQKVIERTLLEIGDISFLQLYHHHHRKSFHEDILPLVFRLGYKELILSCLFRQEPSTKAQQELIEMGDAGLLAILVHKYYLPNRICQALKKLPDSVRNKILNSRKISVGETFIANTKTLSASENSAEELSCDEILALKIILQIITTEEMLKIVADKKISLIQLYLEPKMGKFEEEIPTALQVGIVKLNNPDLTKMLWKCQNRGLCDEAGAELIKTGNKPLIADFLSIYQFSSEAQEEAAKTRDPEIMTMLLAEEDYWKRSFYSDEAFVTMLDWADDEMLIKAVKVGQMNGGAFDAALKSGKTEVIRTFGEYSLLFQNQQNALSKMGLAPKRWQEHMDL